SGAGLRPKQRTYACRAGKSTARPARTAAALLAAAADLQADRRAEEAELFAQPVDEEALVREMKRRRDVGEENERRRRHADLRRVENPHVLVPGADRRIR